MRAPWRMLSLALPEFGQQLHRPDRRIKPRPVAAQDRHTDVGRLEQDGQQDEPNGQEHRPPVSAFPRLGVGESKKIPPGAGKPGRQPRVREHLREGEHRGDAEQWGIADAGEREGEPDEWEQPHDPRPSGQRAHQGDPIGQAKRHDDPERRIARAGRGVLDDDPRHDGRPHDLKPRLREPQPIGIDQDRQRASHHQEPEQDRPADAADRRISDEAPAEDGQPQGPQAAHHGAVPVRPGDKKRDEPAKAGQANPIRLEIAEEGVSDRKEHHRPDVRPHMEVHGAGGNRQDHEHRRRQPVKPGADQAMADPGVEPRQGRGRREQESVEPAHSMHDGHRALGQPFEGDPGPAAEREAERVRLDHATRREHLLPGDRVPERPRVAKELGPPEDHQAQPDSQEKAGLRPPVSPRSAHAHTLAVQRPIAHGLGHAMRLDLVAALQVGHRAGHPQDLVVRPGRQAQFLHRGLQHAGGIGPQDAIFPHLARRHPPVHARDPSTPNRSACRARALSTSARKSADVGPGGASESCVKGTAGTSTCRSMRSSSGPEILLR